MNKKIEELYEKRRLIETDLNNINLKIDDMFRKIINDKIQNTDIDSIDISDFIKELINESIGCKISIIMECLSKIGCQYQDYAIDNQLIWYKGKPTILLNIVDNKVNGVVVYNGRGGPAPRID